MLLGLKWWQALLWTIVGAWLGQHFGHKHPVPSVRSANGG